MDPNDNDTLARFLEARRKEVEALGLTFNPAKRYRWRPYYDTQQLPASAGSTVQVFNTATSSKTTHARGTLGCNLTERGKMDANTDFLVVALGFQPVNNFAAAGAKVADVARAIEYGMLRRLWVNDKPVLEELHLDGLIVNRGTTPVVSVPVTSTAGGTVPQVVNGQPGFGGQGWVMAAYERAYIKANQEIHAEIVVDAPTALAAAVDFRLFLFGVAIESS